MSAGAYRGCYSTHMINSKILRCDKEKIPSLPLAATLPGLPTYQQAQLLARQDAHEHGPSRHLRR
jgi:hypothetical protein